MKGSAATLEALPLADDEKVIVVVALGCAPTPECAVCYADKEITIKNGEVHSLSLTSTIGCVVPTFMGSSITNCL